MVKSCRICKQTHIGTSDGLAQVNGLNSHDSRWKNIDLDPTGDLNINNIRRDQSGDYKVEINSNNMILQRQFCMAVGE